MRFFLGILVFLSCLSECSLLYGRESLNSFSTYAAAPPSKESKLQAVKTKPKYRRPLTSVGLSAALPGLGQAYNKKYWKPAVVWAIMAIPIYFTVYSAIQEKKALSYYWYLQQETWNTENNGFLAQIATNPDFANDPKYITFLASKPRPPKGISPKSYRSDFPNENATQMKAEAERFRDDFEAAILFTVVAYVLNVLDAFADGYFYKYDISDTLHVQIEQATFSRESFYTQNFRNTLIPGLKISLKF